MASVMLAAERVRRAWELGPELERLTEALNAALGRFEEALVGRLGEDARGRVSLRRRSESRVIEHVVMREGKLFYERGWPGGGMGVTALVSSSREVRILACDRLPDLWRACGGPPLGESFESMLERRLA